MDVMDRPKQASRADAPVGAAGRLGVDTSLLIVDGDERLRLSLSQAMRSRGYRVSAAATIGEARAALAASPPAYAVLALRLADGNGLELLKDLNGRRPGARAVVLTSYGNIASAVAATRLGAFDFLTKPADADAVHNSLVAPSHDRIALPAHTMAPDAVRREHIAKVYLSCGRNVSETARKLRMHRRTLQRILQRISRPRDAGPMDGRASERRTVAGGLEA